MKIKYGASKPHFVCTSQARYHEDAKGIVLSNIGLCVKQLSNIWTTMECNDQRIERPEASEVIHSNQRARRGNKSAIGM
jgi:hypothetical protein